MKTTRLFAPAVLLCLAALSWAHRSDEAALKVLIKALGSQRDVRATLLQKRSDGGQTIGVTVQIDPKKGIRATITQPLVYAGAVSFDDGKEWRNYDPHTNELRIERSPASFGLDLAFRQKLIRQNFEVSSESDTVVAGRKAKVVFMRGLVAEMSDRRLAIDAENHLILRYEVERPGGDKVTMVDTSQVDLGAPSASSYIEQIAPKDAEVKRTWGPVEIRRPESAKSYAGFTPAVPKSFPAGLALQAIHVLGYEEERFVGVRLSDGMAVVTVYLWMGGSEGGEPFQGRSDGVTSKGVKVRVLGEVSEKAKRRLVDQFVGLNEGPSPPGEQSGVGRALMLLEHRLGKNPSLSAYTSVSTYEKLDLRLESSVPGPGLRPGRRWGGGGLDGPVPPERHPA